MFNLVNQHLPHRAWILFSFAAATFLFGCQRPGNQRPTCAFVSPSSGDRLVKNEVVTISAEANDKDGTIQHVTFFANGKLLATDKSHPYDYEWDLSDAPAGSYSLKAKAVDDDNNSFQQSISVSVVTINHALHFDGVDEFVRLPNGVIPLDKGTIEYWFKTPSVSDKQVVVYTGNLTPREAGDGFGSSKEGLEFHTAIHGDYSQKYWIYQDGTSPENVFSWRGQKLKAGMWNHFAVSYNIQGSFQLYLNGDLKIQGEFLNDFSGHSPTNTFMGRPIDDGHYFMGAIDELRIWNKKLSGQTIRQSMKDTVNRNHPDLNAYYRFDLKNNPLTNDLIKDQHGDIMNKDTATPSRVVSDAFQ